MALLKICSTTSITNYTKIFFFALSLCGTQALLAQEVPPKMVELQEDGKVYESGDLDVPPTFPGGITEFYNFVGKNYRVSKSAKLKGRVVVEFIIEKDGSLSNLTILKDIGSKSGKEALRVLKKSPKWIPGETNGKVVRSKFTLPISITS